MKARLCLQTLDLFFLVLLHTPAKSLVRSTLCPFAVGMKELVSSGPRREGKRHCLMRAMPSFMVVRVQYVLFSARALGSSIERSDAVRSLGSIRRLREHHACLASGLPQQQEVEELLHCLWTPSLNFGEQHIPGARTRLTSTKSVPTSGAWTLSPQLQRNPYDSRQTGGCHTSLRLPGCCMGREM